MAEPSWGVRLERLGTAVTIAPSGELRGRSVERLREIIRSREPGLDLLVLDLRDLVEFGDDGIAFLADECSRTDDLGHDIAIVTGPLARRALEGDPRCADLVLHDDGEELLAPFRARHRARRAPR